MIPRYHGISIISSRYHDSRSYLLAAALPGYFTVTKRIFCSSIYYDIVFSDNLNDYIYVPLYYKAVSNNDNSFTIAALEETIPGTIASLYVNIESEFGYQVNSNIEMQIGIPSVTDPVGPDSYGYYIYDRI